MASMPSSPGIARSTERHVGLELARRASHLLLPSPASPTTSSSSWSSRWPTGADEGVVVDEQDADHRAPAGCAGAAAGGRPYLEPPAVLGARSASRRSPKWRAGAAARLEAAAVVGHSAERRRVDADGHGRRPGVATTLRSASWAVRKSSASTSPAQLEIGGRPASSSIPRPCTPPGGPTARPADPGGAVVGVDVDEQRAQLAHRPAAARRLVAPVSALARRQPGRPPRGPARRRRAGPGDRGGARLGGALAASVCWRSQARAPATTPAGSDQLQGEQDAEDDRDEAARRGGCSAETAP